MMRYLFNILLNLAVSILSICSAVSVSAAFVSVIGILWTSFTDNDYWLACWLLVLVISLAGSILFISLTQLFYSCSKEK